MFFSKDSRLLFDPFSWKQGKLLGAQAKFFCAQGEKHPPPLSLEGAFVFTPNTQKGGDVFLAFVRRKILWIFSFLLLSGLFLALFFFQSVKKQVVWLPNKKNITFVCEACLPASSFFSASFPQKLELEHFEQRGKNLVGEVDLGQGMRLRLVLDADQQKVIGARVFYHQNNRNVAVKTQP